MALCATRLEEGGTLDGITYDQQSSQIAFYCASSRLKVLAKSSANAVRTVRLSPSELTEEQQSAHQESKTWWKRLSGRWIKRKRERRSAKRSM